MCDGRVSTMANEQSNPLQLIREYGDLLERYIFADEQFASEFLLHLPRERTPARSIQCQNPSLRFAQDRRSSQSITNTFVCFFFDSPHCLGETGSHENHTMPDRLRRSVRIVGRSCHPCGSVVPVSESLQAARQRAGAGIACLKTDVITCTAPPGRPGSRALLLDDGRGLRPPSDRSKFNFAR